MARFLLPASACAFVISFFLRDRLPDKDGVLPSLRQDPVQTDTDLPGPFDVTRKDVTYLVEPVFNYELWNDHVNIKDVCVIWGKNVASFRRGTSTVRTDNGDGACETVFVKEFEVLEPANLEMRALNKISIALMILCIGVLFFL